MSLSSNEYHCIDFRKFTSFFSQSIMNSFGKLLANSEIFKKKRRLKIYLHTNAVITTSSPARRQIQCPGEAIVVRKKSRNHCMFSVLITIVIFSTLSLRLICPHTHIVRWLKHMLTLAHIRTEIHTNTASHFLKHAYQQK